MADEILWKYFEELAEQETSWYEWYRHLNGWHRFNTFYTHYLKVENKRAKLLECMTPCDHDCPSQIVENTPSDIYATCPQKKADPIQLKFRDILIYSLRREVLHQAFCSTLQIERPSGNRWPEFGSTWYLGDHYDTANKILCPVYLTYRTATLSETINSLCRLHHEPFVLMVPTERRLTPETQHILTDNKSILLSIEAEFALQPDGSFQSVRSISECMKLYNHGCPGAVKNSVSSLIRKQNISG